MIEGLAPTLAMDISGEFIAFVAVAGSFGIAIVSIVAGAIRSMTATRAREQSRREIAAYVAEGTMTPDDAQKILAAGPGKTGCCGKHA